MQFPCRQVECTWVDQHLAAFVPNQENIRSKIIQRLALPGSNHRELRKSDVIANPKANAGKL